MDGMSPELYEQIVDALLTCGPLDDAGAIKALFVDSRIAPWRYHLPDAPDETDRASRLIAFLVEQQRADTGDNALVLFLRVLSERHNPAVACHLRLADLAARLERELGPGSGLHTPVSAGTTPAPAPPLSPDLIARVEELVRQDDLEAALAALSEVPRCRLEALLLGQRLAAARTRERQNLMSSGQARVEYSQIAASILQMLAR